MTLNKLIRLILIIFSLIIVWELFVVAFKLPEYILPTPYQTAKTFIAQFQLIATQSIPTIIETLIGLLGAIVIGSLTALLMAYLKTLKDWLKPVLLISQALPTFAIAPLFVIWMGYGMPAKIATIILMLYFPIASSFFDGLSHTKSEFLDLAKISKATKLTTLFYIRVPAALPHFATGLRVATAGAPMGAIIGEWVGSSKGLGFLILNANARMQIDVLFAALLMLILWNFVLYFSLDWLLKIFVIPQNRE